MWILKKLIFPHSHRRFFVKVPNWESFERKLQDLEGLIYPVVSSRTGTQDVEMQQRQQPQNDTAVGEMTGSGQTGSTTTQRPQSYNRAGASLLPLNSQNRRGGYGLGASVPDSNVEFNADMLPSHNGLGSCSASGYLSPHDRFGVHGDDSLEPETEGSLRSSNDSRTRLNPDDPRGPSPQRRDRLTGSGQGYAAASASSFPPR